MCFKEGLVWVWMGRWGAKLLPHSTKLCWQMESTSEMVIAIVGKDDEKMTKAIRRRLFSISLKVCSGRLKGFHGRKRRGYRPWMNTLVPRTVLVTFSVI